MTSAEAFSILQRNGENSIDIDSVSIWKLLIDKITHPFYLFQISSVIICKFSRISSCE